MRRFRPPSRLGLPLLAVWLISEPFAPYHAAALVLVLGGIWLAQKTRTPQ